MLPSQSSRGYGLRTTDYGLNTIDRPLRRFTNQGLRVIQRLAQRRQGGGVAAVAEDQGGIAHIGGSEDRPVSMAKTWLARSA